MNENQEPGIVRADILQAFTALERTRARLNIRAAKMPLITEALVYGLQRPAVMVIRYEWDGAPDLDTTTTFLGESVGYPGPYLTAYLSHSGDDTASGGYEEIIVDLAAAYAAGAITGQMPLVCAADWYPPAGGSGPATLTVSFPGLVGGSVTVLAPGSTTPASTVAAVLTVDPDQDTAMSIFLTPLGNWSSDGNDTAPGAGRWYYFERVETTEPAPAETDEDEGDFDTFPDVDETAVHWEVQLWQDGVQDTTFAWESETLDASLAEDIFSFRAWFPVPNLEDTEFEEDTEETESTIHLEPIEPLISSAMQAMLDAKLEFVAATPITDSGMTALGFTDQLEVTAGGGTHFIPVASAAWA